VFVMSMSMIMMEMIVISESVLYGVFWEVFISAAGY